MTLTDAETGLLVGFTFSILYGLCGVPIARLADCANRRNVIVIAISVWSFSGTAMRIYRLDI